jgi:hypothetical protein
MSEAIEFTSNGKSISAELFKPGGAGAKDGVIIIAHGTDELLEPWGVQIRQYAEALAEKGFIALIPRYFLSTETAPGFEISSRSFSTGLPGSRRSPMPSPGPWRCRAPIRLRLGFSAFRWVAISVCGCGPWPRSWSNSSARRSIWSR